MSQPTRFQSPWSLRLSVERFRSILLVIAVGLIANFLYWALFPLEFHLDVYTHVKTLWDPGWFSTVAFEYPKLAVENHVFPYTSKLPGYPFDILEYPFLAGYFFYALYLLSGGSFSTFVTMFQFVNLAAQVGIASLVYVLGKRFLSEKRAIMVAVLYSLTPSMLYFAMSRYDPVPAFFSLLSVFFFVARRYRLSYVWLAVGALFKFYPAILLLVYARYGWVNHLKKRFFGELVLIPMLVGTLVLLPIIFLNPSAILRLPFFLATFGWNWESIWGPIDQFLRPFVPQLMFFYVNQAWMRAPFVLTILSILLLDLKDEMKLVTGFAIGVLYWLDTAWFFSPQYALWIYPLLLILSRNNKFLALALSLGVLMTFEIPAPFSYVFPLPLFYYELVVVTVRISILLILALILLTRIEKTRVSEIIAANMARLRTWWTSEE